MINRHPYAAHARFARPAFAASAPWRVAAVLAGFELIVWVVMSGIYNALLPLDRYGTHSDTQPFGTFLWFALFGMGLALFVGLVRILHGRGIFSLIGPVPTALQDFYVVLRAVLFGFAAIYILVPGFVSDGISTFRPIGTWLIWLVPGLIVVCVQCAAEEVVYRGYLQQQIAALWDRPVLYLTIPSVFFGLAHFWNGYGPSDSWLYVLFATLLGLACADLTARTGTLGAAIGLHFANNIVAAILFSEENSPGSGLALVLYEEIDRSTIDYGLHMLLTANALIEVLFFGLILLILWLAARIALRC